MADRFFCPNPPVEGRAALTGDEAHHLSQVRRLTIGQPIEVFDGCGSAWRAEVIGLAKRRVELRLGEPIPDRSAAISLTLATAVPKGERFDWLVEKATELGVSRLIPVLAQRSIVDPRSSKLERLRRVIIEAAKQCGRNRVMELDAPVTLEEYVARERAGVRLMAHPGGFAAGRWPRIGPGDSAALAIGPEGGFTDGEVEMATRAGWLTVGLGATLLRIETAAVAGCAAVFALAAWEKPG